MSVVPERGMPSTNTGRSDRAPSPAFALRSAGEKTCAMLAIQRSSASAS